MDDLPDDPWTTLSVSVPADAAEHLRKLLDAALMLNGFGDCRFIIGPVLATLTAEDTE